MVTTSKSWCHPCLTLSAIRYNMIVWSPSLALIEPCLQLLTGNDLNELIKGFLATLDKDSPFFSARHADDTVGDDWIKALRWCPRELLDLINSKACRGE